MTIALPRQLHSDWLARLRTIMVLRPGQRVVHVPGIGVSASRRAVSVAAASWWLAGGAPAPVAAYQPKGAASLATSYVNLVNPGTYDAAPGVAPSFNAATGWTFNGTNQYLNSGVVPSSGWSLVVRFAGSPSDSRYPCGEWKNSATNARMGIRYSPTSGGAYFLNGGLLQGVMPAIPLDAVAGVAGQSGYVDGAAVSGSIPAWSGATDLPVWIGALNYDGGYLAGLNASVYAFAIYNTTLTAPQVAAVSAAMAAL